MKIEPDKNGYLDKECPNKDCLSKFKVWPEDWGKKEETDIMFCPFCGHQAPFKSWYTTEQIKQLRKQAFNHIKAEFGRALQSDANNFNRRAPKGFITMTMKFRGTTYAHNFPAEALEEMEQKITCEKCGSRYSIIGSAFYCPFCGHNSARQTFSNTTQKVNDKILALDKIYKTISETDKDAAVRIRESLIETSLSDLVVAFQRLCECIYPQLPGAKPLIKNVFQRLDDGNNLWKDLLSKGYEDWSSPSEYNVLKICFQQRHLLQHQDGIIDQNYIKKSGDAKYSLGQHLIISKEQVLQYLVIVEKIGNEILKLIS
jgi:Zn finger protein HypA/HybF involved in hydrogenase expression